MLARWAISPLPRLPAEGERFGANHTAYHPVRNRGARFARRGKRFHFSKPSKADRMKTTSRREQNYRRNNVAPKRHTRRRLFMESLEERALMAGLVGYWAAENNALDTAGAAQVNNGTLLNGTAFAAGQVGQAFSFDGVNDRVQIADSPSFQLTQSLSLEGWIKVNALPATIEAMIFFRGDSRGGLDPYVLMLNPSGQLQFRISSETAGAQIQAPVSIGQFIHVAATLDDSTGLMSLYQNGVLAAQASTAIRPFAALDPTQNPAVGIGNANSTYNAVFTGLIDDLKLYDHALAASDVLADFNASKGSLQPSMTLSISDVSLTEGSSHFNVSMPDLVTEATNGGLNRSSGMTYGPDGNLYVGSFGSREILKYSPSGTFLGAFVSNANNGGLTTPAVDGVIFRPDGKLYVASRDNANVLRFDATTGAYIDEFIKAGSGGLSQIKRMEFGSDGNIYLSSAGTNQVLRFSGSSRAYLGQFVSAGSGGLANPRSLTFGPDGNLYVSSTGSNSVLRYHGTTGVFIDAFIPSKRGGLFNPGELLFNNGNLYVASQSSNQVLRFDGTTGAFMDAVVPSNSVTMDGPIGLLVATDGNLLAGSAGKVHRFGASTNAVFAVNLASYWPTTVTVDYQTANVSAQSGSDYQALPPGSLTFLPGAPRTQTIVIPTMDDSNIETTETFTVTLSNESGANIQKSQGIGTMFDNDTKFYVVDDSTLNRNFEYADNGTAGENYNLTTANTAPRGAASTVAGDKVWVVDANRNVYVYNAHGTLVGSCSAGSLNGSSVVEGITVHGNDVWIVDAKSDKVYRYDGAASRLSGSQNAASSFNLNSSNTSPKDLVTDGASIWVVNDSTTDKVFKYSLTGSLIGPRRSPKAG